MNDKGEAKFMNAESLMKYRNSNADKVLPSIGPKDLCTKEILDDFYEKQEVILLEERTEKLGNLSQAVYHDDSRKVELMKIVGKFWQKMGYSEHGKTYLYPEEALFLLESVRLEIYRCGVSLSVQEGYALLLNEQCSLDEYLTYTHLSRLGYVVVRPRIRNKVVDDPKAKTAAAATSSALQTNDSVTERMNVSVIQSNSASDSDEQGISIVYENINNTPKKSVIVKSEKSQDHAKARTFEPTIRVEFPNAYQMHRVYLPVPPAEFLPPNVTIEGSMTVVHVDRLCSGENYRKNHIYCNSPNYRHGRKRAHEERYHRDDQFFRQFESQPINPKINNWKEYKCAVRNMGEESWLQRGPLSHLWRCADKPLLKPMDAVSLESVLDKLNCIQSSCLSNIHQSRSSDIINTKKISFEVHLPNSKYKKTDPPLPDHRLVVLKVTDDVPALMELASLQARMNDDVPIHFAIVDNGSVTFHRFNQIHLPRLL